MNKKQIEGILRIMPANPDAAPSYEYLRELTIKQATRRIMKEEKILIEITDFCRECPSHENCPEEECVLFRIEQIIEDVSNSKEND